MRLIAWNANYNAHRRTFEQDVEFLYGMNPDLIVLSETKAPINDDPEHIGWFGEPGKPGLGVIARNSYSIADCGQNKEAPRWFAGFRVMGPCPFNLLAAWPTQYPKRPRYGELLNSALDYFGAFLEGGRSALVGDLNSSSDVLSQKKSHGEFVAKAAGLGLQSVYHAPSNRPHGGEPDKTYRHGGKGKGLFHIDYCFLSPALLDGAKIEVLKDEEWKRRSDHSPIYVEIPNPTQV
jgi:hypothetical protein